MKYPRRPFVGSGLKSVTRLESLEGQELVSAFILFTSRAMVNVFL